MKIAIVTGAAQGIGRRTAEVLAAAGYGLLLMDMQACTGTVASVRAAGVEVEEVLGDISDEAVVARAVDVVRKRWGRADVLVNNAGISFIAPAETVEVAKFRRVLEGNLLAPFLLAKGFGGLTGTLAAEGGGRGVRVNAVCPGWVKTEMDIADQAAGAGYNDADIEGVNPMGRFATPEDIAQAILFLAEPERSGFVNGHTLVVDGGWTTDGSWQSLRMKKR